MKPTQTLKTSMLLLVSAVSYVGLTYYTERTNFTQLIFFFALSFAAYIPLSQQDLKLKIIIPAAIFFRLLLIFSWPGLSDDYFRFIWDGRLWVAGENPFLHLPSFYQNNPHQLPGINIELFKHLNSPNYYSVYPPICQFVFAFSAWIAPESNWGMVLSMRFILLIAEVSTCILIIKLLQHFQKPVNRVAWYAFNPLVVIELTGNLHFEALLICGLLGSIYLLNQHKLLLSGAIFGLTIGVKMIPLLFMPFLLAHLGWKEFLIFASATGLILVLLFLPFLSQALFQNIGQSLDLYFQKFEYNASVYYVFRWLGSLILGYNIISVLGPFLSFTTFIIVIAAAFKTRQSPDQNLPTYFLLALSIYFFLATTVHPWYLTTLVALSVFTPFRYALVWSGLAILSYATYQNNLYHENYYGTAIEYCLIYGWLIWEILKNRRLVAQSINLLKN